jgi:hypothetical protein
VQPGGEEGNLHAADIIAEGRTRAM